MVTDFVVERLDTVTVISHNNDVDGNTQIYKENNCDTTSDDVAVCLQSIINEIDLNDLHCHDVADCISETVNEVVVNVEKELRRENMKKIHSNPNVVKSILTFEQGEMMHEIGSCVTCFQIRPVFHVTKCSSQLKEGQPSPIASESWKLFKDGRCKKCHEERLRNRREVNQKPAKFSGIYSVEEDLTPPSNEVRHNNMHFRKIPPYLQGLSTTEIALISKISVITNVHVLKTGMFSGRGHTISLPHPMTIATKLRLFPEEVNIVLLTRLGANNKLRQYLVLRSSVEKALQGLCYGFPHGGSQTAG